MINTKKLIGLIAENGKTKTKVAEEIGITSAKFCRKFKKGVFNSDEISKMIQVLKIEDPMEIFFADFVTCEVTAEGEN